MFWLTMGCRDDRILGESDDADTDTSGADGTDSLDTNLSDEDDTAQDQCAGQPDFSPCHLVTTPDRGYDICVRDACVSPGCGWVMCNVPGPHFPLRGTRQEDCYDDVSAIACPDPGEMGFGQDAQYDAQIGSSGIEEMERRVVHSGEPVILDHRTELMWQGCMTGLSGEQCEEGQARSLSWQDALFLCDALEFGGHGDWRLPDEYELMSIVEMRQVATAFDIDIFPATRPGWHWTSSTVAIRRDNAWLLHFGHGSLAHTDKSFSNLLRCVRGGAMRPGRRDVVMLSGDRVVTDSNTGLMWQGCPMGLTGDTCRLGNLRLQRWQSALSECETLSLGGYDDWRLPSVKELHSLVDNQRYEPAMDSGLFPATPHIGSWTSTTDVSDPAKAWSVNFEEGYVHPFEKRLPDAFRCVRAGDS